MSDIPERWTEIVNELRGTANSIASVGEDAEDLMYSSSEFCAYLDGEIFECQACGWWCGQDEMGERDDDEWICEQCTEEGH